MSKKNRELALLKTRLRRLARRLDRTGCVAQGSVFERKKRGGGSRYQWTWKNPKQKTVSVTLSAQQFAWLKRAIARARAAERTLEQMRRISQRIVLKHVPGPPRRKALSVKI
jgi:hypothetical protein